MNLLIIYGTIKTAKKVFNNVLIHKKIGKKFSTFWLFGHLNFVKKVGEVVKKVGEVVKKVGEVVKKVGEVVKKVGGHPRKVRL